MSSWKSPAVFGSLLLGVWGLAGLSACEASSAAQELALLGKANSQDAGSPDDTPEVQGAEAARPRTKLTEVPVPDLAFLTEDACRSALAERRSAKSSKSETSRWPRVASYNVRWFPDGRPGKNPKASGGTNLGFLACTIGLLNADVVALQEIKLVPRAREAINQVLEQLESLTGESYGAVFDECPQPAVQHVGLLYRKSQLKLRSHQMLASLNPHGGACEGSLRPGLRGVFDNLKLAGPKEFAVVAVHLKSGADARDLELRERSFEAMTKEGRELPTVYAGDLNTMGCSSCSEKLSAVQERELRRETVQKAGMSLLETEPGCSEYYRGEGTLLDGFVTAKLPKAQAVVAGYCRHLACDKHSTQKLQAYRELSDHCPLVYEF